MGADEGTGCSLVAVLDSEQLEGAVRGFPLEKSKCAQCLRKGKFCRKYNLWCILARAEVALVLPGIPDIAYVSDMSHQMEGEILEGAGWEGVGIGYGCPGENSVSCSFENITEIKPNYILVGQR